MLLIIGTDIESTGRVDAGGSYHRRYITRVFQWVFHPTNSLIAASPRIRSSVTTMTRISLREKLCSISSIRVTIGARNKQPTRAAINSREVLARFSSYRGIDNG